MRISKTVVPNDTTEEVVSEALLPFETICGGNGKRTIFPPVGLRNTLRLWWGKARRAFLVRAMKGYVRRRHELRRGQCVRCGACCQLGVVCPSLRADSAGRSACRRYDSWRDPSCQLFPMTHADLRDRDIILPDVPCGFHFVDED